jgi:hypothetical protein
VLPETGPFSIGGNPVFLEPSVDIPADKNWFRNLTGSEIKFE